jgi:transcription antitermination factor NusG
MVDKRLSRLWYVLHTKSRFENVVNDGLAKKFPESHLEIVKTAGAVRLIGSKQGPVSVPEETIDSLKIMVTGDHLVTTGNSLKKGDKVLVVSGPFVGVTGTFIRYGGKGRVVVNIEALGQYAGVEVSEDEIEILPKILT